MKWYWRVLIDIAVILALGGIAFAIWWNTPLGPPLDYGALPADYTKYWETWAKIFGAGAGSIGIYVCVMLTLIWRNTRAR